MVTMVTKQKIFDQLYFFETGREEPIPHKSFTLLGQGSHEIPGGLPDPPYPMWVPIPSVTEGLRSWSSTKSVLSSRGKFDVPNIMTFGVSILLSTSSSTYPRGWLLRVISTSNSSDF